MKLPLVTLLAALSLGCSDGHEHRAVAHPHEQATIGVAERPVEPPSRIDVFVHRASRIVIVGIAVNAIEDLLPPEWARYKCEYNSEPWASEALVATLPPPPFEEVAPSPVILEPSGHCANADWTGAMACADAACVEQAAGAQCVTCVTETQACIDGRSSGCDDLCVPCLGAERCVELENVALAATHLTPAEDRGYYGTAPIAHRIGPRRVRWLHGVTPDDLRLIGFFPLESPYGHDVGPRKQLVDATGRVLRSWDSKCASVISPRATWIVEFCDEDTVLRELRTGFLRARFQSETSELVPQGVHSFGGERFLLLRGGDGEWLRYDLLDATIAQVFVVSEHASPSTVLSPDGLHAADGNYGTVRPIGAPDDRTFEPPTRPRSFHWIDGSTFVLEFDEMPPQVVSLSDGRVLREVPMPESNGRDGWTLHVVGHQIVWVARTEEGPRVKAEDGPERQIQPVTGYTSYQVLRPGSDFKRTLGKGFGVSGAGDLVLATEFGLLTWSADGLRDPDALRGDVLWFNAGRPGELLVGMSTGAASVNIETGEVSPLGLPADYRLIDVRRAGDALVALGSMPGEKETERRKSVLIRDASGDAIIELEAEPLVATLDAERRLQVIDEVGLHTYVHGKRTRTTKQEVWGRPDPPPGTLYPRFYGMPTRGGPPRAVPTQGLLSPDGSRALFVEQGEATLLSTRDHKVLRVWPADSCAFARRTNVIGCLEGVPGDLEAVTYDDMLRPILTVDVQPHREVVDVSDDGEQILTADGIHAYWDLANKSGASLLRQYPNRYLLGAHGALIKLGPTYLELFHDVEALTPDTP